MKKTLILLTLPLLAVFSVCAQQTVTKEEALSTANWIEKATNSGNPGPLEHFIDIPSLCKRMAGRNSTLKDIVSLPSFQESFAPGIVALGTQITAVAKTGSYRLLRT